MKVAFAPSFPSFRMPIRGPFVRSASLGGGTFDPLPTGSSPTPTAAGLPSPPASISSSSYSQDGTQSTNQQNAQWSTAPSSSPATSRRIPGTSISTPFPSLSQSDGTSTNYKGPEASTYISTSISLFSHSSMSTDGGTPTNGPPFGSGITTLPPPVRTGGTTSQTSPTTFGPSNSDLATNVSSDTPSPSPPSDESWLKPKTLPSIEMPSSLPSFISSLPSSVFIPPTLTIPSSPPINLSTFTSLLSSILASLPPTIPAMPSIPPTSYLTNEPPTTSDTNLSTLQKHTSSQQSTSPLTSPTPGGSPTMVPGAQPSYAPQSSNRSPVNTPIPTGNGFTVSSIGSPTPSGSPVGNPLSTTLYTSFTGGVENVISTTPPIPHGGYTLSPITYTSIGTSTIVTYSCSGSISVLLTLTSTSTSVIRTTSPVPTSGVRSSEAPIIGGIVGAVLALLLLVIAACYLIRRRRRSRAHRQLYASDLTTLSLAETTIMRENDPFRPMYSFVVRGQGAKESRGDLHQASNSFGSSTFPHPSIASSPHRLSRGLSDSISHENFDRESNDGDISLGDQSEGTFASAPSFYASSNGQPSLNGGIGIAIGSQSSMDFHSYHTAATMLDTGAPIVDVEGCSTPSPSAFPVPPVNPFLDGARVIDLPYFEASRAQIRQAVPVTFEDAALAPMKIRQFSEPQASWGIAAGNPEDHDVPTPKAIRSFNTLIGDEYDDDRSSQDLQTPTQSRPQVTPFDDSSFIINPFLCETSQEGSCDDSGGSDSYETVSIKPYPFQSRDKGKGQEHLSADLMDDPKNNRLSDASSALQYPENPVSPETVLTNFINLLLMRRRVQSQCGLAL
ncbi:uncharacterized protein EDB93DRAFT_782691 [Suillus bovinus]|uniref:uncharacterized protein n=1 Tax=Suillus bovinus TaxID=48563 RepID=UPI001B8647E0|nr:uncharacterized protein EDB93DRAFT_782691 [Suillus bovinus]KAG2136531.1 hypothetical protein EDB93DRAFT_782691 [Suillus bovinus]